MIFLKKFIMLVFLGTHLVFTPPASADTAQKLQNDIQNLLKDVAPEERERRRLERERQLAEQEKNKAEQEQRDLLAALRSSPVLSIYPIPDAPTFAECINALEKGRILSGNEHSSKDGGSPRFVGLHIIFEKKLFYIEIEQDSYGQGYQPWRSKRKNLLNLENNIERAERPINRSTDRRIECWKSRLEDNSRPK